MTNVIKLSMIKTTFKSGKMPLFMNNNGIDLIGGIKGQVKQLKFI